MQKPGLLPPVSGTAANKAQAPYASPSARRLAASRQPVRPPASAGQRFARSRLIQQKSAGDRYNPPVPSDAHGSRVRHACVTTLGIIASFVPVSRQARPGAQGPLPGRTAGVCARRRPCDAGQALPFSYLYVCFEHKSYHSVCHSAVGPGRTCGLVITFPYAAAFGRAGPAAGGVHWASEGLGHPATARRGGGTPTGTGRASAVFCKIVSRVVCIATTALSPQGLPSVAPSGAGNERDPRTERGMIVVFDRSATRKAGGHPVRLCERVMGPAPGGFQASPRRPSHLRPMALRSGGAKPASPGG